MMTQEKHVDGHMIARLVQQEESLIGMLEKEQRSMSVVAHKDDDGSAVRANEERNGFHKNTVPDNHFLSQSPITVITNTFLPNDELVEEQNQQQQELNKLIGDAERFEISKWYYTVR
jgi:hypothetical protein